MRNPASTSLREAAPPIHSAEANLRTDLRAGSWSDLIGSAPPISPLLQTSPHLHNKRILITGAGGSIGSALALSALASAPASLILLDTSEGALYQVDRSLHDSGSRTHVPILGSVCDTGLLSYVFRQHRPQIVFHAAALKHVPLMEQNPFAAIESNALGTLTLAQASTAHSAQQLVLVSTDKAVDPHSIMGASKRIAELILLTPNTLHTAAAASTRFTVVRLCNVLGSHGSVLPLFRDQIARGGPITVTHPDAERYFITLDHAIEALFAALETQPHRAILIPDPGPALRILDLARHLLQTHASSAAIEFTGLRPGDKLSEQLLSSRERRVETPVRRASTVPGNASILHAIESPAPAPGTLYTALSDLREAVRSHDLPQLLDAIHALVPEYQPSSVITDALTQNSAPAATSELHA